MTESEAVAEAERAARKAGYPLEDYEQVSAEADDQCWRIFYKLKPPGRVGGHFSVSVDETGAVRIVPGR